MVEQNGKMYLDAVSQMFPGSFVLLFPLRLPNLHHYDHLESAIVRTRTPWQLVNTINHNLDFFSTSLPAWLIVYEAMKGCKQEGDMVRSALQKESLRGQWKEAKTQPGSYCH
jgi:hypothetical protein